ncbi:hypothetical protein Tco_0257252 [Tanacetum coccineum]
MYRPTCGPPSPSPQPNQVYSLLNCLNLDMDMDNLFSTQEYYTGQGSGHDYYAGQGSGGNQEFHTGEDYSMDHGSAHGSTQVEDDSSIEEMATPAEAEYDHEFSLEPCWEIWKNHPAWKQVEMLAFFSKQYPGSKKAKTLLSARWFEFERGRNEEVIREVRQWIGTELELKIIYLLSF